MNDYALVRRVLPLLSESRRNVGQPGPGDIATSLGLAPAHLQQVLERWAGTSFAALVRVCAEDHPRRRLSGAGDALAAGRDGAFIHDYDVTVAATVTDADGRRGDGLDIAYGFHDSPFGVALVMMTKDGVCGLAFADDAAGPSEQAALDDMRGRWPRARFRAASAETGVMAERIFGAHRGKTRAEIPLVLIGTAFDQAVWQALLRISMGRIVSYADIARHLGRPEASRAVGTANGRNPISFVVPCHRALRGDGALGGYYWGLDRKRALLTWEALRAPSVTP